jgi:hypothetical protein
MIASGVAGIASKVITNMVDNVVDKKSTPNKKNAISL